jgi:hypothetical protein
MRTRLPASAKGHGSAYRKGEVLRKSCHRCAKKLSQIGSSDREGQVTDRAKKGEEVIPRKSRLGPASTLAMPCRIASPQPLIAHQIHVCVCMCVCVFVCVSCVYARACACVSA